MGRPPSPDRKEVVTLRLRQSIIDAAQKQWGDDWRSRMEAAIEGALKPVKLVKAPKPKPEPPPDLAPSAVLRRAIPGVQFGPTKVDPGRLLKQPKVKR